MYMFYARLSGYEHYFLYDFEHFVYGFEQALNHDTG